MLKNFLRKHGFVPISEVNKLQEDYRAKIDDLKNDYTKTLREYAGSYKVSEKALKGEITKREDEIHEQNMYIADLKDKIKNLENQLNNELMYIAEERKRLNCKNGGLVMSNIAYKNKYIATLQYILKIKHLDKEAEAFYKNEYRKLEKK